MFQKKVILNFCKINCFEKIFLLNFKYFVCVNPAENHAKTQSSLLLPTQMYLYAPL